MKPFVRSELQKCLTILAKAGEDDEFSEGQSTQFAADAGYLQARLRLRRLNNQLDRFISHNDERENT